MGFMNIVVKREDPNICLLKSEVIDEELHNTYYYYVGPDILL